MTLCSDPTPTVGSMTAREDLCEGLCFGKSARNSRFDKSLSASVMRPSGGGASEVGVRARDDELAMAIVCTSPSQSPQRVEVPVDNGAGASSEFGAVAPLVVAVALIEVGTSVVGEIGTSCDPEAFGSYPEAPSCVPVVACRRGGGANGLNLLLNLLRVTGSNLRRTSLLLLKAASPEQPRASHSSLD